MASLNKNECMEGVILSRRGYVHVVKFMRELCPCCKKTSGGGGGGGYVHLAIYMGGLCPPIQCWAGKVFFRGDIVLHSSFRK